LTTTAYDFNFALGILAEAVGLRIPVVVLPFVNSALAAHPAFQRSVTLLRDAGIDPRARTPRTTSP
jgi:hypothetical protein